MFELEIDETWNIPDGLYEAIHHEMEKKYPHTWDREYFKVFDEKREPLTYKIIIE